jgi:hypothetical protein
MVCNGKAGAGVAGLISPYPRKQPCWRASRSVLNEVMPPQLGKSKRRFPRLRA